VQEHPSLTTSPRACRHPREDHPSSPTASSNQTRMLIQGGVQQPVRVDRAGVVVGHGSPTLASGCDGSFPDSPSGSRPPVGEPMAAGEASSSVESGATASGDTQWCGKTAVLRNCGLALIAALASGSHPCSFSRSLRVSRYCGRRVKQSTVTQASSGLRWRRLPAALRRGQSQ
jgi:hypothetical protein